MSSSERRTVSGHQGKGERGKDDRAPLSRQRIFEAALAVAHSGGGSAVTMRRVARVLGVEAMSLYHHVRDREDLLDGMAETMVRTGLVAPQAGMPISVMLTNFARGIRATALAHPEAFRLVGLRPLRSAEASGATTGLLSALGAAGMSAESAVISYRVVAAYARGFSLSEIAGLTFGPGVDMTLPVDLLPYSPTLRQDTGATFEAGLAAIVDGFNRSLPSA